MGRVAPGTSRRAVRGAARAGGMGSVKAWPQHYRFPARCHRTNGDICQNERGMGYTHYWHRPPAISEAVWGRIRSDFERLILPLSDAGIELAGGLGIGPPEITHERIWFNGPEQCGHPLNEDLIIPYPSPEAEGVGPASTAIEGDFYGVGVTVRHRCCNGSCSFETFSFERLKQVRPYDEADENGLYGEYVKTGFRPYDIAVTALLLISKHYVRHQFVVHSDGADAQWSDARRICQRVLGYGDWFGIIEEKITDQPGDRAVNLRVLVESEAPQV